MFIFIHYRLLQYYTIVVPSDHFKDASTVSMDMDTESS